MYDSYVNYDLARLDDVKIVPYVDSRETTRLLTLPLPIKE